MPDVINTLTKRAGRIRPQFELDRPMAWALALYMGDNELTKASPVFRKALKEFLPSRYIEEARKALAKRKNSRKRKAAK